MSKVPPPPQRKTGKGEPPARADERSNLSKPSPSKLSDLNFKVSADFKRDFKVAAANRGCTQKELLIDIFREWEARNG